MNEQTKKAITWLINPYGQVLVCNGYHNLDDIENEDIENLFTNPLKVIIDDNEQTEFFTSLGYTPTILENGELFFFYCDDWGNDNL